VTKHTTTQPVRRLRHLTLTAIALTLFSSGAMAQSRWATLQAIHCLENPNDRTTPGPCGELGAYQFREATWRMYSGQPFVSALDRSASDAVAVRHYEWLKQQIEGRGITPTAYNIALAWNGGLRAVIRGRSSRVARDYAQRAANLAWSFDRATASQ
jgi:hypothetical protein